MPAGTWHAGSVQCAIVPMPFESLMQILYLDILKFAFQTIEPPQVLVTLDSWSTNSLDPQESMGIPVNLIGCTEFPTTIEVMSLVQVAGFRVYAVSGRAWKSGGMVCFQGTHPHLA